jgi:BNR/Asp-box repeat
VPRILVATQSGLHTLDADAQAAAPSFAGRPVTAIVRDGSELWAIVDRSEIWHEPEEGWRQVTPVQGRAATCIAVTDAVHLGTSEAHLLRLEGSSLAPVAGFEAVEGRDAWYTPWGGPPDTRSISEWDDDVYVNVHVGGVERTDDHGQTWHPTIDIDADVHQVATAEGLVLAATAHGLASSTDRGATWTYRTDGLEAPYARAVVVSGDEVLMSTSNGPRGGRAGVYRARLTSGPFERCRTGLPEWFEDNIDTSCLDALNDGSYAAFGTADGAVYASDDGGVTWHEVTTGLPPVHHLLVVPG